MAIPSETAPAMDRTMDNITKLIYGRTRTGSIQSDICVSCGKPATEFRDAISAKEYTISGLCQSCQDSVFSDPESDDE